ncbi:MAG: hypothetical protein RLW68_00135 [Devosia marina]|jgi:hypothetical protein|uniref:hypothetical protein n=1 Tax=Devosia marina TaxID=2683198 RepID=UPI000D5DAC15
MRLVLSLSCLFASAAIAVAQPEPFNPYGAALEALPLAAARPILEATYGQLTDASQTMDPAFTASGITLLSTQDSDPPAVFLFCDDKMAGVMAPVPPSVAADILLPLSGPSQPAAEIFPTQTGVMLTFDTAEITVVYEGIGSKNSHVVLMYPEQAFRTMTLKSRCSDLAAQAAD